MKRKSSSRPYLQRIFDFYLNSSIHVALAAIALTVISFWNFDLKPDSSLLIFIFFGTITGYNFVKYAGIAKLHHVSLTKNLRLIQLFSLLCFLGFIFSGFFVSLKVLAISAIMALITVLYALPFIEGELSLRDLSGMKVFVIVFVWSTVTVILPLADHEIIFQREVLLLFFQRYFILLALVLPFEIRDLRYDMARLGTIPQKLGVKRTRILGMVWVGFFVLIEFLKFRNSIENVISVVLIASITVTILRYSTIRQQKYFASFFVEAVPLIWLILLFFLREIIF